MYVIKNVIDDTYFTGNGWNDSPKEAQKLTKLRAEEIVDSLQMKVEKGWEKGKYECVPAHA